MTPVRLEPAPPVMSKVNVKAILKLSTDKKKNSILLNLRSISFTRNKKPLLYNTVLILCYGDGLVGRVKSGNFGHQVNSDIHLQTVEIQMRRLLMSRLIRIFTVCLVTIYFYSKT